MSFEYVEMSELIEDIAMGPFGSDVKVDTLVDEGIPFLSGSNVTDFKLNDDNLRFIDQSKYDKFKKAMAKRGDIIITHRGTLGQIVFIPETSRYPEYIISQSQFRVRVNEKVIPQYLVYFFHSRLGQHILLSNASRVGVPALARPTTTFKQLRIPIPDLETQNACVRILDSIQNMIEINTRINDYLSNIAEAVFTHFQITHKTSECHLSDIAYIVMGQSPPGESYNTEGRGIMFFQGRAEFGQFFPTPNLFTDQPKRLASKGDILISVRAPVGDINIAIADCCIGRGLAAVRSNNGCQAYIHHLIDSIRSNFDQFNGTGTVFGSINKNELNSLTMHIVDSETMKECNSILSEIDAAIKHMHDENELLIKIRMLLMSKFLSSA